jgi:hypothetical protein
MMKNARQVASHGQIALDEALDDERVEHGER